MLPQFLVPCRFVVWSAAPNNFNGNNANEFNVSVCMGYNIMSGPFGVRPFISLTPEYVETMIGDGTMENPYRAA